MTVKRPNTAREALIAEVLGDLDGLLARVEALPVLLADAEERFAGTTKALEDAGDKYRMAVTAFTEQAKADLTEYYDLKTAQAAQAASRTVEEQRAILQEIASTALQSQTASLGVALQEAAKGFQRSMWSRMMEHTVTALIASSLAAGMVYAIVR
jgi:hypothetical protein